MSKSFRDRELIRTLLLLGPKSWIYFIAVLINAAVLGFSFNLVLAFLKMDVTEAAISGEQSLLIRALIMAAVTFLTGVPLLIGSRYVIALFEKKALTSARVRAFQHIVKLPISNFDKQHSGDLLSRCTNDLNTLGRIYTNLVPVLFFGLVLGLVGMISILILNWQLGIFALLIGLLTTFFSTTMAKPLRERSGLIQESLSILTQRLSDLLQSLPVTKMFHLEEITHDHYAQANQMAATAAIDHARTQAIYEAVNTLIEWMRSIGTLVLGLFLLKNGNVGLGAVVAAIHLQSNASFMFTNFGDFVTGIQKSLAGSARVFELFSWPREESLPSSISAAVSDKSTEKAMISLRDLSFGYGSKPEEPGDKAELLLDQVNITVKEGQFAALVGPSGGGKSTLIKILMGLYPASQGMAFINQKSISSYPLQELRDLMAYVPQDAYLFDGTIEENILYGRPEASPEEVIAAAKSAHAHEFILEQPDGYQTLVGERGARLSGGQRQRIAIARALLKNAPILLLDEATSALDSESEAIVQEALEVLMEGRTTIAIAHRLSTIQDADAIFVMEAGRVIEQGSHESLLALGGVYHDLFKLQGASQTPVSG